MPFLRRAGRAFTLTDPKKKLLSGLCRDRTNLALMRLSITGTMKSRVNRARAELAQLLSIEGPEDFEEDRIISAIIVGGGRLATGA
jgi:hypothetical protein